MTPNKNPVLITGGGTGIGAATAKLFALNGYPVIISGRRREVLDKTANAIMKSQPVHGAQAVGRVHVIPADLRRPQEVEWLAHEAVKEAGTIGTLVNNAGVYEVRKFIESDDDLWQKMWESNFMSMVRLTRALLPELQKNQGAIVNLSSTAGLNPVPGAFAYVVSKAAVISFTENLALDLAKDHVRVNCICPGVVTTEILKLDAMAADERAKVEANLAKMHPLGRAGKADDVAWMIYQLCIPQTQWMTGVVLPVDGGLSLK
jgi:NAD(P)-dependent dehydrogenase (short-subunit alcohol dehydrogenase family)